MAASDTFEEGYAEAAFGLTTQHTPRYCDECWYKHSDGRFVRKEGLGCVWVLRDATGKELDWDTNLDGLLRRHFG